MYGYYFFLYTTLWTVAGGLQRDSHYSRSLILNDKYLYAHQLNSYF